MESNPDVKSALPGQAVALVFYMEGHPWVIHSHVAKAESFAVETTDANVLQLESERKVVLISHEEGKVSKAEAIITGIARAEFGWRITLSNVNWESSDRRRYPRYAFKISVTIRRVEETQNSETKIIETRGETEDISFGGAWVKTRELLEEGTLVEFRAILSETENIRALAVIAHTNPVRAGMGIEFVDYMGATRGHLNNFLSRAA